jgi:hypothetical protein
MKVVTTTAFMIGSLKTEMALLAGIETEGMPKMTTCRTKAKQKTQHSLKNSQACAKHT